jgi:hypothetical protein
VDWKEPPEPKNSDAPWKRSQSASVPERCPQLNVDAHVKTQFFDLGPKVDNIICAEGAFIRPIIRV